MSFIMIILIAVSLSMDAFSLSLAYGTLNLKKRDIRNLSFIVAIYHFFMPLIGMSIGDILLKLVPIKTDFVVFLVLLIIGIEMILESNKEKEIKMINKVEMIIFGLAVSLDSLSVGIGLHAIYNNTVLSVSIISLSAGIFTYFGLILGKKINNFIGKISTIIGGIFLIIIGIIYLF